MASPRPRLRWMPRAGTRLRFGARRTIFQYIKPGDDEGQALQQAFLRALSAEDVSIDASARATLALLAWAKKQQWDPTFKGQFMREVTRRFKLGTYGRAALDVRIDELVKDIVRQPAQEAAKVWSALQKHLWGSGTAGNHQALRAFQRLHDVMGPLDDGWGRLLAMFDKDAISQIAAHADQLRDGLRKLEGMPPGPARKALQEGLQEARGTHSRIKGILGEIYLAKSPAVLREMDDMLDEARFAAAQMGRGWEAMHVVGNIKINNLEAYDQAVVIVNWAERRVVIHTAVQMKVEVGAVSAFKQIERDLIREAGKAYRTAAKVQKPGAAAMRPPVGHFEVGDHLEGFSFVDPEPWMATHRYVYFAEGGKVGARDVDTLKKLGVEANVIPVDLPVSWLDALALEVMAAAKKM